MEFAPMDGFEQVRVYKRPNPEERERMQYGRCILIQVYAGDVPSVLSNEVVDRAVISGYFDGELQQKEEVMLGGWPASHELAARMFLKQCDMAAIAILRTLVATN